MRHMGRGHATGRCERGERGRMVRGGVDGEGYGWEVVEGCERGWRSLPVGVLQMPDLLGENTPVLALFELARVPVGRGRVWCGRVGCDESEVWVGGLVGSVGGLVGGGWCMLTVLLTGRRACIWSS